MRRAITVQIAGKGYRVVTDAEEQWLQGVAARVDEAMSLVRDRTETVDSLDVAVLTALNLARELTYEREGRAARAGDAERMRDLIELAEAALSPRPEA